MPRRNMPGGMMASQYKDGSYTGSVADAYYGYIQVRAIISGGKGKAEDKLEAMKSAGIAIASSPAALGTALMDVLKRQTRHAKLAE